MCCSHYTLKIALQQTQSTGVFTQLQKKEYSATKFLAHKTIVDI